MTSSICCFSFFFFNDTATTEIYTLSLHDALPIFRYSNLRRPSRTDSSTSAPLIPSFTLSARRAARSEEHTSELQSRSDLVCRLLLEKKKQQEAGRRHTEREQPQVIAHRFVLPHHR